MDRRISFKTSVLVTIIATVMAVPWAPAVAASDDIAEYALPPGSGSPVAITAGPDGNMWFTQSGSYTREDLGPGETGAGAIGRITPTGIITQFPLPTAFTTLGGIAAGPDGNLWFTETFYSGVPGPAVPLGGAIGRITPEGAVTEYRLAASGSNPQGIAAGPDGNLWFTQGNTIGRITTDGLITDYPVNVGGGPYGIAAGPDGNLWLAGWHQIVRVTTNGATAQYLLPTTGASDANGIVAGPDEHIWFTEYFGGKIGRISTNGDVTEYNPFGLGDLGGIARGPDGNIWFTAGGTPEDSIGRITPEGAITHYRLPTSTAPPGGIAAGPDGNMWFTHGGKIGRISPVAEPTRKRSCRVSVTLHKPAPKTLGHHVLIDEITTDDSCVVRRPVVRCRPLTSAPAGGKVGCDTRLTRRGRVIVNTKRDQAVRVTVIVRVKPRPETKAWFDGQWKLATWRKSWVLR